MTQTAEKTNIVEITNRSRCLGYNWTNRPEPHAPTPTIQQPDAPASCSLMLSQVAAEHEVARRTNSGNWWNYALFVRGRRVVGVWSDMENAWIIGRRDIWCEIWTQRDIAREMGQELHLKLKLED